MSTNCLFGFSLFGEKLRAQWAPGGQKEDEKKPDRRVFHSPALILLKTFLPTKRRKALWQRDFCPLFPAAGTGELLKKGTAQAAGPAPSDLRYFPAGFALVQSSVSSIRATMRVAVVTYSLMLNFFTTRTS